MTDRPGRETVTIENTRILFRNFAGREDQYNSAGNRNFAVVVPDELAEELADEGWNIKVLNNNPEEEPLSILSLTLGYKGRPPRVVMVTESGGRTPLNEDSVEVLDYVDIKQVDVIFRPYHWKVRQDSGIKAYVKSLFVVIYEDALELKYKNWGDDGPSDPDEIES